MSEHPPVHEVAEWNSIFIPNVSLSDDDRRLCENLSTGDGPRLVVEELRDRLRVRALSWIGVVRLSAVEIHVVPKLAGEHLGLLRMLEWSTGLDALRATHDEYQLDAQGARLPDLLALLFVRAAERIVRAGLRSDYLQREEAISTLRGRLLIDRQLRVRHGRLDRLECRYDDRSADIFDNQLLLAGAEHCSRRAGEVSIRRRAGRLRAALRTVCEPHGVKAPRRMVVYDRLNSHYRGAHELAWLLLEGSYGIEDIYQHGSVRTFAFLLDMNQLFERFVEKLLEEALRTAQVRLAFQRPSGSVIRRADTGATYLRQIPDVLVRINQTKIAIPLDAKYKLYSSRRLDPSDVAQTFLYGHAFGPAPSHGLPHALIVYPSETGRADLLPLQVQHVGGQRTARLTAVGVPIVRALDEAQRRVGSSGVLEAVREAVLEAVETVHTLPGEAGRNSADWQPTEGGGSATASRPRPRAIG
jgi:5-methylcytosine-specific restriction enzyme subunit McrC